jgi:FkbM family methyltransferase
MNQREIEKFQELERIKALPRYQPDFTEITGAPTELTDGFSLLHMYWEIIEQQIYRFEARGRAPYIIDGGANIGLSVYYFKQLYPAARVVAFEPDETLFAVLERNVRRWGFQHVELVRRALWSAETTLAFRADGALGGRVTEAGGGAEVSVQTARLRDYLDRDVDLLKLDIEGAETEVLLDCADLLPRAEHVFVEYHSFAESEQTLHVVMNVLAGAGFRLHVQPQFCSERPFVRRELNDGMDLQLNIFAFRPSARGENLGGA